LIYLVDKSAWQLVGLDSRARSRFASIAERHEIATCPAIAAELLYSARNNADLVEFRRRLETLTWLESSDDAQERMLRVQYDLARRGQHRGVGVVDLLIAATAEANWSSILHYDSDFERIADVTGQPHEWIVPRGEGHLPERTGQRAQPGGR
jgi:predicted nucleic acid-binding protein